MMKKLLLPLIACLLLPLVPSCLQKQDPDPVDEPADDGIPHYESLSVAAFLGKEPGSTYYHLQGKVAEIRDAHYSQFVLDDGTAEVLVYGLWASAGGARLLDMNGLKAGDEVSIAAQRGEFADAMEARKAFPYDPEEVVLYVAPAELHFPSTGGTQELDLYAVETPVFDLQADWVHLGAGGEDGKLPVTVDAHEDLEARAASFWISCRGFRQKVKIYQEAFLPDILPIESARSKDFARVAGTITVIGEDGYVLADESGALFVSGSAVNLEAGIRMDVIGRLSTEGYLTRMTPLRATRSGSAAVTFPEGTPLTADYAASLLRQLQGKDASNPSSLPLPLVSAKGILAEMEGEETLLDFDTDAPITRFLTAPGIELAASNGGYVSIRGYLAGVSGGDHPALLLLPATLEDAAVEAAVTIDGTFADWEGIPGWEGADGAILQAYKLYTAGTDLYLYARISGQAFTEWGPWKYFLQAYFNTDLDNTTGPYAWVFPGLDASGYVRMTTGTDGAFTTDGSGSVFNTFLGGDGLPFISANPNLFAGFFYAYNASFPCGGALSGDSVQFEWKFPMSRLKLPRHCTVGTGLRFCHEGPDTPSGAQENHFLPADGWTSFHLP